MSLHSLLLRQLKKLNLDASTPPSPEAWQQLLERISRTYGSADEDRYTMERSLELSHAEMYKLNRELAAERDRMSKEMEIAKRIQTALVPVQTDVEDYDLTMEMITATEVGGDLIDYCRHADGVFWLAVGDVTGHGLTPGLVMMMAQTIFTGFVMKDPAASPSEVLTAINQALHQNVKYRLRNDNYMTLQLIRHVGDGKFIGAGMHCDILIHRSATKHVERIEVPGVWTGFMPDIGDLTEDYQFEMGGGDIMLIYTDGLIEAKNAQEEQYDMDRLEQALVRYAHLPVEDIKANILTEVQAWQDAQLDDISIVVLRRHALKADDA